jgi:hypothetical protein
VKGSVKGGLGREVGRRICGRRGISRCWCFFFLSEVLAVPCRTSLGFVDLFVCNWVS